MGKEAVVSTQSKYSTRNPVSRFLVHNFFRKVDTLLSEIAYRTALDVGCGEGVLLASLRHLFLEKTIVGVDVDPVELRTAVAQASFARLTVADAAILPFRDNQFDLVMATEVLEHLSAADGTLQELNRVCKRFCLLSVPDEPLWRILNMARGSYLGLLGNTPGHVNHWSRRAFEGFISHYFDVRRILSPLPWTLILAEKR
jgi:ubiquinone/menaquinone biosynthesis C-methylase UbiE